MTARERILGRVREALRTPAPRPGGHGGADHATPTAGARAWLPPGGVSVEERLDRFRSASAELRTEFFWLDGPEAAASELRRIAGEAGWRELAGHRGTLTEPALEAVGLPVLWVDDGYDPRQLERCDAGVTECEALVAQTGGVVIASQPGGRALSVLPPHHVVLARREQLAADLPEAFERLEARWGKAWPGMISFVTGPSRTGDIERILVLGAHGPKRLTVIAF